jgi:2,4-diaminopentanoate dehydrogenase
MDKIKVIIWGFGAMGKGMASMIINKKGVEIVGVCDLDQTLVGKNAYDFLNIEHKRELIISDNIDQIIGTTKADVCLLCTDSLIKGAYGKIVKVLSHKINCICIAEEMAYPKASEPELAKQLDLIAKAHGVSVLGTGINPGFMMDLLVVALSGVMADVEHIKAKRVNSLNPFGPTVLKEQGVGLTINEYHRRMQDGSLAGHIGFKESTHMIADALGVKLDNFNQQMDPIMTSFDRQSAHGTALSDTVAGIHMTGQGLVSGNVFIDLIQPQQIEPEQAGVATKDTIELTGIPNVSMTINPEVDGGIGTIAMCVNMIPHVINAKPGLRTMIDLPVPRAILGDMRDLIENE